MPAQHGFCSGEKTWEVVHLAKGQPCGADSFPFSPVESD